MIIISILTVIIFILLFFIIKIILENIKLTKKNDFLLDNIDLELQKFDDIYKRKD